MLPSPVRDKPFWAQMLVFGFAAFGATCFAGMVFFFLLNVAASKPPSPTPTASVPPSAPQQQAPPPPPINAGLGLQPLPTEAQVKAAVAAQMREEKENGQLPRSEETDISQVPATRTSPPSGTTQIKQSGRIGCARKEYYDKLLKFASQDDNEAFNLVLAEGIMNGICTKFELGESVYIQGGIGSALQGLVKLRRPGDPTVYWAPIEAVK